MQNNYVNTLDNRIARFVNIITFLTFLGQDKMEALVDCIWVCYQSTAREVIWSFDLCGVLTCRHEDVVDLILTYKGLGMDSNTILKDMEEELGDMETASRFLRKMDQAQARDFVDIIKTLTNDGHMIKAIRMSRMMDSFYNIKQHKAIVNVICNIL